MIATNQAELFTESTIAKPRRPKGQLLKWIGNKQRFAEEIISFFPKVFGMYYEPFLGSGAVLGTLAPRSGIATDAFAPLIGIWLALKTDPEQLKRWYAERWALIAEIGKKAGYEQVKASYNREPNAADLVFLSRACYGGVVRFRKHDGYMSTPCGVHDPISPESFAQRVDSWSARVTGTEFGCIDYRESMLAATAGDLIYCDPPYTHSQTILYGAQSFDLRELFDTVEECKRRGVGVVLSVDGTKRSGDVICNLPIPPHLFDRELLVECGRSMLKRFQMNGQTLHEHAVADRLLLTF